MAQFDVKIADGKSEVLAAPVIDEGMVVSAIPKGYIGKKVTVCVWCPGWMRKEVEGNAKPAS